MVSTAGRNDNYTVQGGLGETLGKTFQGSTCTVGNVVSGVGATIGGAAEGLGQTATGAAQGLGSATKGLDNRSIKALVMSGLEELLMSGIKIN